MPRMQHMHQRPPKITYFVKQFIQTKLINAVKNQAIGAYYGFQCDEVTDGSNWEQLGLILRYVKDHQPVEHLLEYIPCDCTTG